MLIEVKRFLTLCKDHQKTTLRILDALIRAGLDRLGENVTVAGQRYKLRYMGLFVITFEHSTFEDGRVYLNGSQISETELARFLSFGNEPRCCR